jgi:hypothetical protein
MPYFRRTQVSRKLRALFLGEICVPAFGPGKLVSGCMLLNRIFHIFFEFGPVALSPRLYGGHIQGYLHLSYLVFDPAQGPIQGFTPRYRFADVMPNASAIFRMETPENRQVVFRVVSNLVRMFEYRSCRFSAFGPSIVLFVGVRTGDFHNARWNCDQCFPSCLETSGITRPLTNLVPYVRICN